MQEETWVKVKQTEEAIEAHGSSSSGVSIQESSTTGWDDVPPACTSCVCGVCVVCVCVCVVCVCGVCGVCLCVVCVWCVVCLCMCVLMYGSHVTVM